MRCSNCGYELQEGMKYCPECGMRVLSSSTLNGITKRPRRVLVPEVGEALPPEAEMPLPEPMPDETLAPEPQAPAEEPVGSEVPPFVPPVSSETVADALPEEAGPAPEHEGIVMKGRPVVRIHRHGLEEDLDDLPTGTLPRVETERREEEPAAEEPAEEPAEGPAEEPAEEAAPDAFVTAQHFASDAALFDLDEPSESEPADAVKAPAPVLGKKEAAQQFFHDHNARRFAIGLGVFCVLLTFVVALATGAFAPAPKKEEAPEKPAQEQKQEESEPKEKQEEQKPAGPAAVLPASPKSFGDYSWSELAGIAQEIAKSGSRDKAMAVAERYGLADKQGSLTTETRGLVLKDGTEETVRIAGIYADDTEAGGKAGITFLSFGGGLKHAMNDTESSVGGWEKSRMRAWLASDQLQKMPDDLRPLLVAAKKRTNNVGYTADPASVTATSDTLWIPSFSEVYGTVDWNWLSESTAAYNKILGSEGAQYQIFSQSGIENGFATASDIASLAGIQVSSGSWWLRTASPSGEGHFRDVGSKSGPLSVADANVSEGVVTGFCL